MDLTNENGNEETSSVRVRPGCTLKLYKDYYNIGLLDSLTTDNSFLSKYNDKVSSLSCTCQGMTKKISGWYCFNQYSTKSQFNLVCNSVAGKTLDILGLKLLKIRLVLILFHQHWIVKPFKLLETLQTAMLVYIYLPMKELQPNQTILFGKLLKGIGSSSILDQEKDGELVQRRV